MHWIATLPYKQNLTIQTEGSKGCLQDCIRYHGVSQPVLKPLLVSNTWHSRSLLVHCKFAHVLYLRSSSIAKNISKHVDLTSENHAFAVHSGLLYFIHTQECMHQLVLQKQGTQQKEETVWEWHEYKDTYTETSGQSN